VILDAAVGLLERAPVNELSVRAVARHANISERTVFRYFATRDDLLDAVANEVSRRLDLPPHPSSVEELLAYPEAAYARFEATVALTKAALHSELYHRIRSADADRRGAAIRALIDRAAPTRSEHERKLAAANIRYYLIASTWHYYRFYFGLSLEDSVECARLAIAQALQGLGARGSNRPRTARPR
jgi:AcrR family transcriptional regulator